MVSTYIHKLFVNSRLFVGLLILSIALPVMGQDREKTNTSSDGPSAKDRWAFKTNTVDWLLVTPNIGMEWDISSSPYNKWTLNLSGKWNWDTYHKYNPSLVYNLWDVRTEVRKYWRTERRQMADQLQDTKRSLGNRLRNDVFTRYRRNPRYWRSYYGGVYVSATDYTLKLSKTGKQGTAYGMGVSGGFGIPLYGYGKNHIDLEIGGSIGMLYTRYDAFSYDAESDCYPKLADKSKDWHIVPYPVVTDVRVAFVYRFTSIRDKYKLVNYEKQAEKQRRALERKAANDSINEQRKLRKEEKTLLKDSIGQEKRLEKEQRKAAKKPASPEVAPPTDATLPPEEELPAEEGARKEEEGLLPEEEGQS